MMQLYQGDCLEVMKNIPDKSVDMILCDLPYGTTSCPWDTVIPFDKLWGQYKRIIKPAHPILLFGSEPFASKLRLSNLDWYKYDWVWNKNKCGSPGLAKRRPLKIHETISVFCDGTEMYIPQMESGTPYFRKRSGKCRANSMGYGFANSTKDIVNTGTRYPKSIINISRDFSAQQQVHPTQKPVPLCEYLIKTYTNTGDTVLDNCMGSGSTGIAAIRLGRNFIGIELDPQYFELAKERIENERPLPILQHKIKA